MPGQLHLFGGKRQRGRAPPAPPESKLQQHVADLLTRWHSPGWRFTHFPAGGKRPLVTAAILKRQGLKRGWPDFLLLRPAPPLLHMLELKRRGETLTDEQEDMRRFCEANGYPYEWADDLEGALMILARWGAIRVKP